MHNSLEVNGGHTGMGTREFAWDTGAKGSQKITVKITVTCRVFGEHRKSMKENSREYDLGHERWGKGYMMA